MQAIARFFPAIGVVVALCLQSGHGLAQDGRPQQILPDGIRGGSEVVPEPGVEIRTYRFDETGEELPYSVFVSSKIRDGEKAPLIVALRGFTGTTLTFVRGTAVDLAEQGGYILVGPIGYNNRAGYGVEARPPRAASSDDAPPPAPRPLPPLVGGSAATDPAETTEYSERDVMNVLAIVREEFAIDDRRIYLMGHSQGGGGARHLAEKYPSIWAGVALLAPALFDVELDADSAILDVPLMIAIGTEDFLIDGVRSFAGQLETLNATYEYAEFDGLDHGTIIMGSMPEVFAFFAELASSAPR